MPRKARPRTSHLYHAPILEPDATLWDAQREVNVLERRLANEQAALETWQRRLAVRTAWEHTHSGPTQLPLLRQECAATHARCLALQEEITRARGRVRALLAP